MLPNDMLITNLTTMIIKTSDNRSHDNSDRNVQHKNHNLLVKRTSCY